MKKLFAVLVLSLGLSASAFAQPESTIISSCETSSRVFEFHVDGYANGYIWVKGRVGTVKWQGGDFGISRVCVIADSAGYIVGIRGEKGFIKKINPFGRCLWETEFSLPKDVSGKWELKKAKEGRNLVVLKISTQDKKRHWLWFVTATGKFMDAMWNWK